MTHHPQIQHVNGGANGALPVRIIGVSFEAVQLEISTIMDRPDVAQATIGFPYRLHGEWFAEGVVVRRAVHA